MKTATNNKLKKALAVLLVTLLALIPLSLLSFAADAYTATFTVTGGEAAVNVYYTQDLTNPDETNVARLLQETATPATLTPPATARSTLLSFRQTAILPLLPQRAATKT